MDQAGGERFKIFIHIQKTGGITLQRLLRNKWNSLPNRMIKVLESKLKRNTSNQFADFKMNDKYYIGHNCFGIHRLLPQPFEYVAFLREPVARVISLYTYSKSNPTAYYHKHAKNSTLEDFALNSSLMELDNGQTRFIAGDEKDTFINRTPINEVSQSLLDLAISNIENHFSMIGLTEEFEASVLMMAKLFHWKDPYHLKLNEGKKPAQKEEISSHLKDKIRERNSYDVKLYEYVKNNFHQRLKLMNITEDDILEFKLKNASYNRRYMPLYKVYDRTKAVISGNPFRP